MNYYKALEISEDGRPSGKWQFTKTNDGKSIPVGYCRANKCRHNSEKEASDCYKEYINEKRNGLLPGGFKANFNDSIYESASSY